MDKLTKLFKYAAIISLAAAYIFGKIEFENNQFELLKSHFPEVELIKISSSPDLFIINDSSGSVSKYIMFDEGQGWGGPFKAAVEFDPVGNILEFHLLDHKETPSFIQKLLNAGFFEQFGHTSITNKIELNEDINAVSGATISSRAFTKSVSKSAHWLANEKFGYNIKDTIETININSDVYILMVLYGIIIIAVLKKYKKLRYATLTFSVVYLGFVVNSSISISNFSALLMGYFPSANDNFFLWLLLGGTIFYALVMGKNIYCYWLCPFGGTQELVNKIGGINLTLTKNVEKYFRWIIYFLFWFSFMIMFLTNNPSMGTFEPFATLYSFYGVGIQWYIVSVAIIGSFLIPRFWCRFFCPVGTVLKILVNTAKTIKKNFSRFYEKK